jgi:hypothetical protein|tara:strand:+ start:247 stop:420 length:174 start_codon:yes stop_codon:yes gene_type:complete
MKVKVLNQIKVRGKLVNLFNYQYVSNDGSYLSAIFQTTKQGLESVNVVNERFNLANS